MPRRINLSRATENDISELAGEQFLGVFDTEEAHAAVLDPVVRVAKAIVPTLSGRLRDTIRREGPYVIADAENPKNGFRYALKVELRDTPFLRIALTTATVPINIQLGRLVR